MSTSITYPFSARVVPWARILAPVAVVGGGLAMLALVDARMLLLCSLGIVLATVGAWLFVRNPHAAVLLSWTATIFSHAVAAQFGRTSALAGLVKQVDEVLIIGLVIVSLALGGKAAARWLVGIPALGFLAAGLASNLIESTSLEPALVGAWAGLKFWVLLWITVRLPWRRGDVQLAERWFAAVVVIVLMAGVLETIAPAIHRSLLPIQALGVEVRFGRRGLQGVFTHPDHFGSFTTVFAAYYMARFVATGRRGYLVLGVSCIFMGLLSLRLKAILGLVAALGVLCLSATRLFVRRLGFAVIGAALLIAVSGGILVDLTTSQIDRYAFGETVSVRESLYVASQEIAADHLPFGVGFGQFGSGASTTYDSDVYEEYGLNRAGLTQDDPGVRHDTTWPTVVGESGVLGLVFFAGGLLAIWGRLFRQSRSPGLFLSGYSLAALAVLTAVLVESSARPSFFNSITSLSLVLVLAGPLEIGAREMQARRNERTTDSVSGRIRERRPHALAAPHPMALRGHHA